MSVDPLAAGLANLSALVDAELAALAADAQALQDLLAVGTVVQARVLPSNGLTDLLEIAGKRVAASLPPTVRPGDVLTVQVTGFQNDQIMVQVLGANPPSPASGAPLAPSPAVFVAASVQTPAAPAAPAVSAPAPPSSTSAAAETSSPAGSIPPRSLSIGGYAAFSQPVDPARSGASTAQQGSVSAGVPGAPTSIEARLAAARAAATPSTVTAGEENGAVRGAQQQYVVPPRIAVKGSLAPPIPAQGAATRLPPVPAAASQSAAAPRVSGLSAYTQPVTLLRALRLPVTPSNVASATLALERPDRLAQTLSTLERALPQRSADPQVATLRTLLGFIGRIEPGSPVLATQIVAYVDQVVSGAEPKLATLLAATRAAAPPPAPTPAPTAAAPSAATPTQTAPTMGAPVASTPVVNSPHAPAPAVPIPPAPTLPAALAVERGAALAVDLKQTLLSVAANPTTPPALAAPIAGALTALTAVQVQAAQMLATQPDGIAFALPLATPAGTANAKIAIKREAPQARGVPLDGANFRIAFVLETAHFGTVAIDLVTVGREVTVDVRAETPPAMRAFRDALGALTARLETLHYRVASAAAGLGALPAVTLPAPPVAPVDPDATVDRSA